MLSINPILRNSKFEHFHFSFVHLRVVTRPLKCSCEQIASVKKGSHYFWKVILPKTNLLNSVPEMCNLDVTFVFVILQAVFITHTVQN